ncbi:MAG: hypothetical protein N2B03_03565 [Boseongicola sp.]
MTRRFIRNYRQHIPSRLFAEALRGDGWVGVLRAVASHQESLEPRYFDTGFHVG